MRKKTLSVLLAIWMIGVAFVGLAANVKADDNYRNNWTNVFLNPNNYPGVPAWWYAPGDSITGWIEGQGGPDTIEDIIDVVAASDDPLTPNCDPFVFGDIRLQADDIAIDGTTGQGNFAFPGSSTQWLSDGFYCAWTAPGDYLEQAGAIPHYFQTVGFEIHLYKIGASTERGGYIPSDTVKVFYTVSKIKDGSLVTDTAFTGEWLVQSTDGLTYWYGDLSSAAGSFTYTILNTGGVNPGTQYPTYVWYNGTSGGAKREASWFRDVPVNNLAATITEPPGGTTKAPGSILEVEVYVEVMWGYPYPGADVEMKVLDGGTPTSPEMATYRTTFPTDAAGLIRHMFVLTPSDFLAGKTYTILANATKILKFATDFVTFDVQTVPQAISVEMTFDKASYYSDDTATVNVAAQAPAGRTEPSTYVYDVSSGTSVFARQTLTVATFSFHVPANFEGDLDFMVDVYNSQGDHGSDLESKTVSFGVMIVSVTPQEYKASDQLTINFELKSTVMGAGTRFFYKVPPLAEAQLTVTGLSGSFPFTVPSVPSSSYTFEVYAIDDGHRVSGSATAWLVQGFMMEIKFDKKSYKAGETITVEYTITRRADNIPYPTVYYLSYLLFGGPFNYKVTTERTGTITYVVPAGANEGDTLFHVSEGSTGAWAEEVVRIGEGPAEIAGIELFDAFLLVLIVILFLLVLAFRFRGAGAGAPKPKEEKPAPPPPPQGPQVSPMMVNCKACGAPIEITTSKRPIEVMCPSCGETALIQ